MEQFLWSLERHKNEYISIVNIDSHGLKSIIWWKKLPINVNVIMQA